MPDRRLSTSEVKQKIIELGPWHINVEVTPEVSTSIYTEAPGGTYIGKKAINRVPFLNTKDGWVRMMKLLYPDGLRGRSFMECACNCGAYCFWAKELGAGRTFGFDA
jgi:tRNA (mo5U34)-methyltransferase